jgi:hypothetical protein
VFICKEGDIVSMRVPSGDFYISRKTGREEQNAEDENAYKHFFIHSSKKGGRSGIMRNGLFSVSFLPSL